MWRGSKAVFNRYSQLTSGLVDLNYNNLSLSAPTSSLPTFRNISPAPSLCILSEILTSMQLMPLCSLSDINHPLCSLSVISTSHYAVCQRYGAAIDFFPSLLTPTFPVRQPRHNLRTRVWKQLLEEADVHSIAGSAHWPRVSPPHGAQHQVTPDPGPSHIHGSDSVLVTFFSFITPTTLPHSSLLFFRPCTVE